MRHNVALKIARTDEEIRSFQKFLFRAYCLELKWHDASKFPGGIFTDADDCRGRFLLVCESSEIVAGMRLVKDSDLGFPHENEICMVSPPGKPLSIDRKNVREVTRLVGRRRTSRVLTADIIKCLHWYGFYNKVEAYCMLIDMSLFILCHKLHVPLVPVRIPVFCEGSWTIPAVIVLNDLRLSLANKNPGLLNYISDDSNLVGDWKE